MHETMKSSMLGMHFIYELLEKGIASTNEDTSETALWAKQQLDNALITEFQVTIPN